MNRDAARWSRRDVLSELTLVGTAGLLGLRPAHVAAQPLPEITRLKIARVYAVCVAPQFVAEELLKGEGFTDVQHLTVGASS